jgi:hypothetical protein
MKNWIPLSFIIAWAVTMNCCTTATKDDTPKEVLAILHQVDSILEIPVIEDSILDPAEGGTNMIHYWLNSKSKELLYHAVSKANKPKTLNPIPPNLKRILNHTNRNFANGSGAVCCSG